MADTSKPTCVIVPGAWHPESAYLDVSTHLQDAGYPVVVARLPSLNPDNPSASTCAVDGDAVRDILLSLIDDGKDIFLLNHSYGGVPGGAAAHGLSKAEVERQGKKGGVLGLVYMSSFVVPENLSLLDYLGGQHPPYLQKNQVDNQVSYLSMPKASLTDSSLFTAALSGPLYHYGSKRSPLQ